MHQKYNTPRVNNIEINISEKDINQLELKDTQSELKYSYIDAIGGFIVKLFNGNFPYVGTARLTYLDDKLIRIDFKGNNRLFQKIGRKEEDEEEISLEEKIKFMDNVINPK